MCIDLDATSSATGRLSSVYQNSTIQRSTGGSGHRGAVSRFLSYNSLVNSEVYGWLLHAGDCWWNPEALSHSVTDFNRAFIKYRSAITINCVL